MEETKKVESLSQLEYVVCGETEECIYFLRHSEQFIQKSVSKNGILLPTPCIQSTLL